ncbi:hypothetical protein YC2023_012693 [Brassica napus]
MSMLILILAVQILLLTTFASAGDRGDFARTMNPKRLHMKEKLTHLRVYWHDVISDGPKRNNVIDRLDYPTDRSRISSVPRNFLGKSRKFFYKRIDRWIYVRKRIDRSLRWTKA